MTGTTEMGPKTAWKALKIRVRRTYIDPLAGFLYPRGCLGLSYDEITLDETQRLPDSPLDEVTLMTAYFSPKTDTRRVAKELRAFIGGLPRDDGNFAVDSVEVKDFGWAHRWKEFFRPIKVGKSVMVTPSWEKYRENSDETLLVIDPGEAFGTGSHETTRLCIEIIEEEFENSLPEKCIDIGCGTGILGILMAKKGAKQVMGIDIDKKAVDGANKNSLVNGTDRNFRASNRPLFMIQEQFDFLTANIIDETLISMKGEISSLLCGGGRAVLSGILTEKAGWVEEEFRGAGMHLSSSRSLGIWSAMLLEKE